MKKRVLRRVGSRSPPSASGAWGSASGTGHLWTRRAAIALIRQTFESGVTFFDTAEV